MIDKRELIDVSTALGLSPQVIEKDYTLGWVLAGIFVHEELKESWIFKGGTCLKKCFFETYRFSEDLDFTLRDSTHLHSAFLQRVFGEVSEWIYETCGLELPANWQSFDIYTNPRGRPACQGKLSYRGPISPRSDRQLPRIKLDLAADEALVLAPVKLPVFHPYSDAPDEGFEVLAYAYEEAFGEKVRALGERTRPRDLYDVINLFRNKEARPPASVLLDVLKQKCDFKGIGIPNLPTLEPHRGDLEGSWQSMLQHQLPALPPLESFWNELPALFAWLVGSSVPETPAAYAMAAGETVLRERTLRLPVPGSSHADIEIIRFAAANRLLVEIDYVPEDGQRGIRRIEPYSLRRTQSGDVILHSIDADKDEHRSYRIDRIMGASVTSQTFTPRYEVELSPQGPLDIPPTERRTGSASRITSGQRRLTARSRGRSSSGPSYVFECSNCGKRFRRKKYDATLKPHKDKHGYPCYGSFGSLVDTKY